MQSSINPTNFSFRPVKDSFSVNNNGVVNSQRVNNIVDVQQKIASLSSTLEEQAKDIKNIKECFTDIDTYINKLIKKNKAKNDGLDSNVEEEIFSKINNHIQAKETEFNVLKETIEASLQSLQQTLKNEQERTLPSSNTNSNSKESKESSKNIKDLDNIVKQLNNKVNKISQDVNKRLDEFNVRMDEHNTRLEDLYTRVGDLNVRVDEATKQNENLNSKIEDVNTSLSELNAKVEINLSSTESQTQQEE
jgi:chromosome segregation ATPase